MTKYFICSILLLAMSTSVSHAGKAGHVTITEATVSDQKSTDGQLPAKPAAEIPVKGVPVGPTPHGPAEKGQGHPPSLDETPHIHHFHKHRVKKLKRHHQKYWLLSKALIIACHVVLLLMAYMHAAH